MQIIDNKGIKLSGFQSNQLLGRISALEEQSIQNRFHFVLRYADGRFDRINTVHQLDTMLMGINTLVDDNIAMTFCK